MRLRALVVTSAQRVNDLPNVPTINESGYKGFDATTWFGLLAPVRTAPGGRRVALHLGGNRGAVGDDRVLERLGARASHAGGQRAEVRTTDGKIIGVGEHAIDQCGRRGSRHPRNDREQHQDRL